MNTYEPNCCPVAIYSLPFDNFVRYIITNHKIVVDETDYAVEEYLP